MEVKPAKIFVSCIKNTSHFKGKDYKFVLTVNESIKVESEPFRAVSSEYIEVNKHYTVETDRVESLKVELFEWHSKFELLSAETFELSNRHSVRDDDVTCFKVLILEDESTYFFVDVEDSTRLFQTDSNSHKRLVNTLAADKNILGNIGGSKIKLINQCLYNLRFVFFLFNQLNMYLSWKNGLKTLVLTISLSLMILHPKITIASLPLVLVFFHLRNRKDLSEFKLENGVHELDDNQKIFIFLTLVEFYNNMVEMATKVLNAIEKTDKATVQTIHRQLFKISLLIGVFCYFLEFNWILYFLVGALWLWVLRRNPVICYGVDFVANHAKMQRVSGWFRIVYSFVVPFVDFEIRPPRTFRRSHSFSSERVVAMEVLENERWWILAGWTKNLLPGDRPVWSDARGILPLERENVKLPSKDFEWSGEWEKEVSEETDTEGWRYGTEFSREITGTTGSGNIVRTRKWKRNCKTKE